MMTLHVYSHHHPHDDIIIAGNREALQHLQEAIGEALSSLSSTSGLDTYCNDGEGYTIHIVATELINELPLSYIDEDYGDPWIINKPPFSLIER